MSALKGGREEMQGSFREWALFAMNKFMPTPVCCCSHCLLITYAAGPAARPKRGKFVNMNNN